ncbi:MAG: enoyl-CoA hydratase-related protein [Paracoccaceae bacterium]
MSGLLSYQCRDGVAVLTIQNPPVNALSRGVRKGVMLGLEHALADPQAQAIVLQGAGGQFSGGIDLSEYDHLRTDPWLAEVCRAVEDSPKPVVALLQGRVLGPAFELALAAQARIAAPDARIGLPDVVLGLPTGSGGAMRAARLAGAGPALDLLLSGRVIGAQDPAAAPFLDEVAQDDALGAAIARATALATALAGDAGRVAARARLDGLVDPASYIAAVQAARAGFGAQGEEDDPAAEALIASVEAAQLLPPEAALEFEAAYFDDLVTGARSCGLRHLYAAERRAPRHITDAPLPDLSTLAVVGRGAEAAGLSIAALDAGLQVVLIDPVGASAQAQKTGGMIAQIYASAEQNGRLGGGARRARLERLKVSDDLAVMRAADSVALVLAQGENGAARARAAAQYMPPERAILVLGDMSQTVIEAAGDRAADVVGVHFARPPHLAAMGEIISSSATGPQATSTAAALLRKMRKIAVGAQGELALSQALLLAMRQVGDELLGLGVTPYAVDDALRGARMGQGIYRGIDAMGLRASAHLAEARAPEGEAGEAVSALQNTLIAAERLGRESGAGFYDYSSGAAQPDQVVRELQEALLAQRGGAPVQMPAADILRRFEAGLVQVGARLLENGAARHAGDIDVAAVQALGYPRALGGPLHRANQDGVFTRAADIRRYGKAAITERAKRFWAPCDLLVDMVKNGRRFG